MPFPGIMIGRRRTDIAPNHPQYPNNMSISCNLKGIGRIIFQNNLVNESYVSLKSKVYKTTDCTPDERAEYNRLRDKLQYGWGFVVKSIFKTNISLCPELTQYYNENQGYIDNKCQLLNCRDVPQVPQHIARHYLTTHLGMKDLEAIYAINLKLVYTALSNIQHLQIKHYDGRVVSARIFLAQVKLSLELERDLAKEILFSYNHDNTFPTVNRTTLKEKHIQKNHKCSIGNKGGFTHHNEDCGAYNHIGDRLAEIIQGGTITTGGLVDTFKAILRSKASPAQALQNDQQLMDKIRCYVELMFFTEAKRNSGALLTNAMFWDLVNEGTYAVTDIAQKMPMAMQGAVSASTTIDQEMGVNEYDYRPDNNPGNAEELNTRDGKLILDWFLQRNLEDTVITTQNHPQPFHENSNVNDLNAIIPNFIDPLFLVANAANLCTANAINFSVQRTYSDNDNNIIIDAADQPVQFHANGTIMIQVANGGILNYTIQMLHVENIAFYHIINNWYGIQLRGFNNVIMRAMAEPQGPDEDPRDQDGSKVLMDDNMDIQLDIEPTTKIHSGSELQNLDIPVQYGISCLGEEMCSA